MKPEQFDSAVEQVLDALGPDFENAGVPGSFVKQVVWDNYFDVQRSVDDIFGTCSSASRESERLIVLRS